MSKKVSVIVTTKNEEKNIGNFLKSVTQQTYKNIETIVVDNNSSDRTKEVAREFTSQVYDKGPERSVQRNFGVSKATGDYVMVLDADMILTSKVVEACIKKAGETDGIKLIVVPEKSIGESFWAKCKAFERNFYCMADLDTISSIEAPRFFERKVFEEFKGYDVNITGPEDWDLPERIKAKYPNVKKIHEPIIHNEGNVSLYKLMKKKYYYALKSHVYMNKHNVSKVSSKTVYFLRPELYRYWRLWFDNPLVSLGTILMLSAETIAGATGFLLGMLQHQKITTL